MNTKINVRLQETTTERFWLNRTNLVVAMGLAFICSTLPMRAADESRPKCSNATLPPPFPTIVSSFVIVDGGGEVKEVVMSPAANIVTATLRQK